MRRARAAVAAVFLTNGALFANLAPRYPQIKRSLGLSNAAFGSAIAAFPLGALIAGLFAATLIGRFRSARVAALGVTLLAIAMLLVAAARNWIGLALVLLVAGALDANIDVAQNTHGLRVQRLYGRSIVNSFHGLWSVGAVLGALMGAAAAGLDLALGVHLAISAALFSAVGLVAYRFMLPGPDTTERAPADVEDVDSSPRSTVTPRAALRAAAPLIVVLGVLAACGAVVEDAGSSWGSLYLTSRLSTSVATGALAFVALQTAMTIGRLLGDRTIDRFGQRTVVRTGGALIAGGMAIALAVPTLGTALAGFTLAGLGVATLVPAVMHTADEIPGIPTGVGLTIVSWTLRIGFLVSPLVVGLVADATSLRVGLLGVVLAGLVVVVFGRVLAEQEPREPIAPTVSASPDPERRRGAPSR